MCFNGDRVHLRRGVSSAREKLPWCWTTAVLIHRITMQDDEPNPAAAPAALAVPPTFVFISFDQKGSWWSRWVSRLDGFCEIYSVPAAGRRKMLLHYIDADAHGVLCDLLGLVESEEDTCGEARASTVIDWKAVQRMQKEGEAIVKCVTVLRRDFETSLKRVMCKCLVFRSWSRRFSI